MDGLSEAPEPVEIDAAAPDQPSGEVEASSNAVEDRFTDLTPDEAPEGGPTPEWLQSRYQQMQADYTRKTQEIATLRARQEELEFLDALKSDPDTQRAVFDQLQELLSESELDEDYEDEPAETNPLEERLQQLENERNAEKAQALASEIHGHITQLVKDAGLDLEDSDVQTIFEAAVGGERIGKDVTEQAFKDYAAREQAKRDKYIKAYLASKEAPVQVPGGQTATDTPDLSSHEARVKRMAAILQGSD